MANKKLFTLSLLFIFTLLVVQSAFAAYTIDEVLTEDFSFMEYSDGEIKEYVYSVALEDYPLLSVELQGHGAYEPTFYLYDVDKDKFAYQGKAGWDEKLTYSFTPDLGEEKNIAKEYYLIILSNGKDGSSFEFSFSIEKQNDAGLEGDATKRFSDAEIIKTGEYTARLGGGDAKDYYAFEIDQDETFTIRLASLEEERLGLEVIESNFVTTINERGTIEGLERTFTSSVDQTIWMGIEGSTPYTFSVLTDKEVAKIEEKALPPLPPMPPEVAADLNETVEKTEGLTTNWLILLFVVVIGLCLFGVLFLRAKIADKKKAKAKK